MSDLEIQILKKEIIATSAYYQLKLDPQVIPMYAEDLSDLSLPSVIQAYKSWRTNPKNFRFPLPGQIRNIVCPDVNPEDQGRDAAARIVSALSKFGYTNSNEAKLYIGSLGWKVVERQGGWAALCERTMRDELPTYQAQWAKHALSIVHMVSSGHDEPPALPSSPTEGRDFLTSNEFQKLIEKTKTLADDEVSDPNKKELSKWT